MAEIIVEFPSPLTEREQRMIYGYKGEIVRCKDCKYFAEVDPAETYAHCPHMRETDFCSLGERREE